MNEPAKCGVEIIGSYNPQTRDISATVNVKFADTVSSGSYRISLFLVEDSVIGYPGLGPFKGWDQHCYDPTWAKSNYPGKFDGESIIGYPHRHVMRDALLGAWGAQGIIPAVPVVGTTYSAPAKWRLDTAYNESHISFIAFVSLYGSTKAQRMVLNANEVDLSSMFETGVADLRDKSSQPSSSIDNIYPQPSKGVTNIVYTLTHDSKVQISVLNTLGQVVMTLPESYQTAGTHGDGFYVSSLMAGVYCIRMESAYGTLLRKFSVR
jgi:hypothetical protein